MNPNQEIIKRIERLEQDLLALNSEFYANNFSAYQDFNKASSFNTRLLIPHYAATPATCQVRELIEVGGKVYICSAADTWTVVGTQT